MEEKTIIEGEFKQKNSVVIILTIIGIISYIIGFFVSIETGDFLYFFYVEFGYAGVYLHYGAFILFVVAILFYSKMSRCSLTVTDKRVYGKASFGKRVDLPINQISSVGLGSGNSVVVATSSGRIKFWLLENKNEIHNEISKLLIQQQTVGTRNNEVNYSNADELMKYKELLDSGVITQEEFDAKKKQLLGL